MKLILILLIANFIFNRKPTGYLYCGLFGWVGANPSTFNRHAFSILGLANESRGGDSCGVYSNNTVKYGTGMTKDFPTFIKKLDYVRAGKDCVVLGHTRRASIGGAFVGNAQPIVLKDSDGNPGLILIHNGTLTNHEELAKKYKLCTKNLFTDSQILAALMYNTQAGLDILGEYNGAATVVFHYPGSNSIFIFKGKSKGSSNYTWETEERPLYAYPESDHSFYFSSLKEPLEVIAKDPSKIFDIKTNTIIQVTGGKIEEVRTIDRSKQYQRYIKPYERKKVNGGVNASGLRSDDLFDAYDDNTWYAQNKNLSRPRLSDLVEYHTPPKEIISEPFSSMGTQMLNFNRGRFHLDIHPVHGEVYTNEYGLVVSKEKGTQTEVGSPKFFQLYFWEGILLHGKEAYLRLQELKKAEKYISIRHFDLLESSPYPVAVYNAESNLKDFKLYRKDDVLDKITAFNGKLVPIFCNKQYQISDGFLYSTTKQSNINKLTQRNIKLLKTWA